MVLYSIGNSILFILALAQELSNLYVFFLQLFAGNDEDEFSQVLKLEHEPKILITTCRFNSTVIVISIFCTFFEIFFLESEPLVCSSDLFDTG